MDEAEAATLTTRSEEDDIFQVVPTSLEEAEIQIAHIEKFNLVARLLLGRVYTLIERNRLYEKDGFKEFNEYLKYSKASQTSPIEIQAAMGIYQVFVETLGISPGELKTRKISLGALKKIVRYADTDGGQRDPATGYLQVNNPDQLLEYLSYADGGHISVRELALRIEAEINPAAEQSFFKITAVEKIGEFIFVSLSEIIRDRPPVECGQLKMTEKGFRSLLYDLKGRLLPHQLKSGTSSTLPEGASALLAKNQ